MSLTLLALMVLSTFYLAQRDSPYVSGTSPVSWNPNVPCVPVLTTIEGVIGNQMSSLGGATFAGGGFKPGIPDKRSTNPPCTYGSPPNATFVEVHNVTLTYLTHNTDDCGTYTNGVFCDTYANVASQGYVSSTTCPACYMHRIHFEIDQAWKSAGIAPLNPQNSTTIQIDMQGFVFWDPFHTTESGHSFSGWELHPLTAWRFSQSSSPDFSISASPSSLSMSPGVSSSTTINVASVGGFSGTVMLANSVSPTSGLTCSLSPTSVTLGSFVTSTLSCNGSLGSYTVTVTGSSGSLSHSVQVFVNVLVPADFAISIVSPVTINPGTSGTTTVTVAGMNGFTGTVSLSATKPGGFKTSFNPTSVTGSGSSTLTIKVASNVVAGSYTITVKGTSGSLSHSANVTVNVGQDFSLSASPNTLTIAAGGSGTSTLTVSAINGFNNVVTLSALGPAGFAIKLSPQSITGSGTSVIDMTVGSTVTAGSYVVTVTGTSGSQSRSVSIGVTVTGVADFSISSSPNSLTIVQGSSGGSTVSIASLNGFAGSVFLSNNTVAGFTLTFSINPITGGSGSSVLTISVGSTVANGAYSVIVTGSSGSLTHSSSINVDVTPPADFTLTATSPVSTASGGSGTSTITITATNGFAGTIALSATGPTGFSFTFNPTSITSSGSSVLAINVASSVTQGAYTVTVTGTSGSLSHFTTVTVNVSPQPDFGISATSPVSIQGGGSGTSNVTITALNGFTGTIGLSAKGSTGFSFTFNPTSVSGSAASTLTINVASTVASGTYQATVTGSSGTLSHSVIITVNVSSPPDFTIVANPTSLTVPQASSGQSTITITGQNGFAGTVTLSATGPNGLTTLFNPSSVPGSGSSTATINVASSLPAGSYSLTITGASGALSHSSVLIVTVTAPDFILTATPSSLSFPAGGNGTSTITVTASDGFTGTVSVTASASSASITTTLNPSSITASGTSTLTVVVSSGVQAGTYTITVTGTSGSLTHSVVVSLTVQDFALAPSSPLNISCAPGSSCTTTITISASNGFTGTVTLSPTPSPGLTASLNPTSIAGSGTSGLTIGSTVVGNYTVTVTGRSGALSHSTAVITVRVVSSSLKVVLQFDAYDADDIANGTSELEIDVNGQFAAYIPCTTVPGSCPAGVTGKYAPYTQVWINGIQIDITKLVVPGTNTIVFRNPLSLHSSGVRNVQVIRNGQIVFSDPTKLATCISSCYDIGPGSTGSKLTETFTLASFTAASISVTPTTGLPQQFAQTVLEVIIALLAIPALWRRSYERRSEKRSIAMRFLTKAAHSLKRPIWLRAIPYWTGRTCLCS